jgi:hypothetical protein
LFQPIIMALANTSQPAAHDVELANDIKAMRLADLDYKIEEARKKVELLEDVRSRWLDASPAHVLEGSASFEHHLEEEVQHQVLEARLEAVEHQLVQEDYDANMVRRGRNRALTWLLVGAAPAAYGASLFPGATTATLGAAIYVWCLLLVLGSST